MKSQSKLRLAIGLLLVLIGLVILGSALVGLRSSDTPEQSTAQNTTSDTQVVSDSQEAGKSSLAVPAEGFIFGSAATDVDDVYVKFAVNGSMLSAYDTGPTPLKSHQKVWNLFVLIAGEEFTKDYISELSFYNGVDLDTDAHVIHTKSDNQKWHVGIDAAQFEDDGTPKDAASTQDLFVHEFAHILTLNYTQVDPTVVNETDFKKTSAAEATCNSFFTGEEGCSNDASYINRFYDLYWADIIDELPADDNEADLTAFYNKYSDRFVTEYAATNPGEDIAETFAVYVFSEQRSVGTVWQQKIDFIAGHPELEALKKRILSSLSQ